jgi:hypothetical protein
MPRRAFLTTTAAGLTLPGLLRAREAAGVPRKRPTAVIQVWLWGGPSHLETYDPKPDAPAEYRGPYGTISTNVPGLEISDLLPRHARIMDRVALLRSVHHKELDHQEGMHLCLTGHSAAKDPAVESSHPSTGSVVSRTRGSNRRGLPPYVRIGWNPDGRRNTWRELPYRAATWGARYDPMEILADRGRKTPTRSTASTLLPGSLPGVWRAGEPC